MLGSVKTAPPVISDHARSSLTCASSARTEPAKIFGSDAIVVASRPTWWANRGGSMIAGTVARRAARCRTSRDGPCRVLVELAHPQRRRAIGEQQPVAGRRARIAGDGDREAAVVVERQPIAVEPTRGGRRSCHRCCTRSPTGRRRRRPLPVMRYRRSSWTSATQYRKSGLSIRIFCRHPLNATSSGRSRSTSNRPSWFPNARSRARYASARSISSSDSVSAANRSPAARSPSTSASHAASVDGGSVATQRTYCS